MLEKEKQKSFLNKIKKISDFIPDSIKHGFKRLGLIAGFVTIGAIGTSATTSSSSPSSSSSISSLTDALGKNIIDNTNICPTDQELKKMCEAYATNAVIKDYYKQYLDSIMTVTGKTILKSDSIIQAKMNNKNGRTVLINSMGNKALGGKFGNTRNTPIWHSHCGWAGMRGFYLGIKKAGTEEFFSNSLAILSNAFMDAANFGYETFANSKLLHVSKDNKKFNLKGIGINKNKQLLLEEIKNHPNDIILLAINNHHRGGSGHHFVKIAGGKLISYNREKISDPTTSLQNIKDIGWWINLSEYERQNFDKSHFAEEIVEQIYEAAQKHLKNKTYPSYFMSQMNNPSLPEINKDIIAQMSTVIVLNNQIKNTEGNKVLKNLTNQIDHQAVTHLSEISASNKIPQERKIEIMTMFQDIVKIPTVTEVKDTILTEEQIFKKWTKESEQTLQTSIDTIQNNPKMSPEEQKLYMTTFTQLLQPIEMSQQYLQPEQIQGQVKNVLKIKSEITKRKTEMALKRTRAHKVSQNKSLAEVRKQNHPNTAKKSSIQNISQIQQTLES